MYTFENKNNPNIEIVYDNTFGNVQIKWLLVH